MSAPNGEGRPVPPPGGSSAPRARVRITSVMDATPSLSPQTRGIALPDAPVREAAAVFVGGLVRSQLRLALGCLLGFLMFAGAFTAAIWVIAHTGDPVLWGVPLSWLLQAYGYYPLVLFFALVYARSASRNEQRYRVLADAEREA